MIKVELISNELDKNCYYKCKWNMYKMKELMIPIEEQYCTMEYGDKHLCPSCTEILTKYQIAYKSFIEGFNQFIIQNSCT